MEETTTPPPNILISCEFWLFCTLVILSITIIVLVLSVGIFLSQGKADFLVICCKRLRGRKLTQSEIDRLFKFPQSEGDQVFKIMRIPHPARFYFNYISHLDSADQSTEETCITTRYIQRSNIKFS